MKLEKNVLYKSKVNNVAFGNLTPQQLLQFFGNGRQCGVFLEPEIASKFEETFCPPSQGDNPDIMCPVNGKIQAKTWKRTEETFFKSGKNKGMSKHDAKSIFTTKSGLWDSMKRRKQLGEDVEKTINDYFDKYDCFMYIDISQMGEDFSYSFIVLDTEYVKAQAVDGHISPNDILKKVEAVEEV